jgi:peptidoglycan hydrolase-like amidase
MNAADSIKDLQKQIDELEELKKMSEEATEPLVQQVQDLNTRISNAQASMVKAKKQAEEVLKNINIREQDLANQYIIFTNRIANQYKRSRTFSPLLILFNQSDAAAMSKYLMYGATMQAQDNKIISHLSSEISQLEADKKQLEADQRALAAMEIQLSNQVAFFKKEINNAREYQKELEGKIAELSAKQQAIIAARSGKYTTSVGEVPLADDFNASIGYKSKAPSNSFAAFSFGAYTHRNGMSQYGAKARAEKGQDVEEILEAYYPGTKLKKNYDAMDKIDVQGVGKIDFESHYLMGIYEMPSSWDLEALMAQAVAARTYAIRHTDNGKRSICTTEACQVFKNSPKGGSWEEAVKKTKNWVLVDGDGNPVSTQYASTHGGYTNTKGWDTTDGSGSGDWTTNAWEKIANSPWFYKAWYRNGYSKSGNSCGKKHPWLSEEEFADIINAWIVMKNPKGADTGRIQPITINDCSIGGQGGNPYSMKELKKLADKSGGSVTDVKGVKVKHSSKGSTVEVEIDTNRGKIEIPGEVFKSTFNLRAPGYVRIPQSNFAFFNIEHKK